MSLKEKSKNLPSSPGVYLMRDSLGGIIYVGKSKNLKNRVQSYFQNSKAHTPKVEKLVKNIKDFEYILTDTEFIVASVTFNPGIVKNTVNIKTILKLNSGFKL